MDVGDFLAAIGSGVDDEPVSVAEPLRRGDFRGHHDAVPHDLFVLISQIRERDDLALGNYQNVRGGFRCDVTKGQAQVVLVDDVRGNFFGNDFGKDRGHDTSSDELPWASFCGPGTNGWSA